MEGLKASGTCQSYLQATGQAKEGVHSEFQVEEVQGQEAEHVHLKSQWGTAGNKAQNLGGRGAEGHASICQRRVRMLRTASDERAQGFPPTHACVAL